MRTPTDDPLELVAATIPGIAAARSTQIARGIVRAFNATTYQATVQLAGSAATWLPGVPVSAALPIGLLRDGAAAAIAFFNPADPTDACLFAVFGRPAGRDDPDNCVIGSSLLNAAILTGANLAYLGRDALNAAVLA